MVADLLVSALIGANCFEGVLLLPSFFLNPSEVDKAEIGIGKDVMWRHVWRLKLPW